MLGGGGLILSPGIGQQYAKSGPGAAESGIQRHRRDITILAVFLETHVGRVAAPFVEVGAFDDHGGELLAVHQVEVLDLQTAGQRVDDQRIGQPFAGVELDVHYQSFAFLERVTGELGAVMAIPGDVQADAIAAGGRGSHGDADGVLDQEPGAGGVDRQRRAGAQVLDDQIAREPALG